MEKPHGRGTVVEIEKGRRYRIILPCGKDPKTGKYRKVTETFHGTKRQAELRVEEIRREVEGGRAPGTDRLTVAEWLEEYMSNREAIGKQRRSTLERDRQQAALIAPYIGSMRLRDLTARDIEAFEARMKADGASDGTVYRCHGFLKAALGKAYRVDLVPSNPADKAEPPKKPVPRRQSLEPDEARRLAALCAEGEPSANKTAVYLALATGARLGEVLGLTWAHVDMRGDRPSILFIQQYTRYGTVTPLKTDEDDNPVGRTVPIDSSTVAALSAWSRVQRAKLAAIGVERPPGTPVVSSTVGTFTDQGNFGQWWRRFCVAGGFGKFASVEDGREVVELRVGDDPSIYPGCIIEWRDADGWPCDESGRRFSRSYPNPKVKARYVGLNFHALRHTHFSLRLADGTDYKTAQYLGGWSTPAMLMNVYAHPVAENIWDSAGFMDSLTGKGEKS